MLTTTANCVRPAATADSRASSIAPYAFQRVDQEQRGFSAGGAGDHVLQKLFMSGSIDNDVLPPVPDEKRPGRVDRNALLLLLQKCVKQERVLELLALLAADRLDLFQLAFRQGARIGIESSHQCGLPMIDMADDDDVETFCGWPVPALSYASLVSEPRIPTIRPSIHGRWCAISLTCSPSCGASPCLAPHPARARPFRHMASTEFVIISSTVFAVDLIGHGTGGAAQAAIPRPIPSVEIEIHEGNVLVLDVLPDVDLRPIEEWMNPNMRAGWKGGFELVPQLRRLVAEIPIAMFVARGKIPLLRPGAVFVRADPENNAGVASLFDQMLHRVGLRGRAADIPPQRVVHAGCQGFLVLSHY